MPSKLYKNGECKAFEQKEIEGAMKDGWSAEPEGADSPEESKPGLLGAISDGVSDLLNGKSDEKEGE